MNPSPSIAAVLTKLGTYKKVKNFLKSLGYSNDEASEIVHLAKSWGAVIK